MYICSINGTIKVHNKKYMKINVMKHLLLLLSLITVSATAQKVSCGGISYSVIYDDYAYYIVTTAKSSNKYIINSPCMKMRTFDGNIITLQGTLVKEETQSAAYMIRNSIYNISQNVTTAKFIITEEQLGQLRNGVSKVLITMMPKNHERAFKKDKIGTKLYLFYQKIKEQFEHF